MSLINIEAEAAKRAVEAMGIVLEDGGLADKPLSQFTADEFDRLARAAGRGYSKCMAEHYWLEVNCDENYGQPQTYGQPPKR